MLVPESSALHQWLYTGNGPELSSQESDAAFQLFLEINYTGPRFDGLPLVSYHLDKLASDGETPSHLVRAPQLLYAALCSLAKGNRPIQRARALVIQQSLLFNLSESIKSQLIDLYTDANISDFAKGDVNVQATLNIEVARMYLLYDDLEQASLFLARGTELSGFVWQVTGVLGRRTRYQQHDVAQLICLAVSTGEKGLLDKGAAEGPKMLGLNSDLLLEKLALNKNSDITLPVELRELDSNQQPSLSDLDSAILLLYAELIRRSTSVDDHLLAEVRLALVDRVINNPPGSVNWSVMSRALWNRSLLETQSPKTVERGVLQMESLVQELGYSQSKFLTTPEVENAGGEIRTKYLDLLLPLPMWALDTALAENYVSIGIVKSALEIYERLGMDADVALLYAVTGNESKAIEVIDRYLERHPEDARGWSIKGDILTNPEYWEKAWAVSRYAPAKRSLGRYYYTPPQRAGIQPDLNLSILHLKDSLQVNGLNTDAWFLLGCVALEKRDYGEAAHSFNQYATLNPDDSKGWSNLGTALWKLDRPEQALHAFKQAIRADRNATPNWRVWANMVTVAVELKDWDSVLEGIGRILQMRSDQQDKFINSALLIEIVHEFTQQPYTGSSQQKAMVTLFTEKLPTIITNDAGLYKLVARVHLWADDKVNTLGDYEKGFRLALGMPDIETNETSWKQLVTYCMDLVDAYKNLGDPDKNSFKARTAVRSTLGKGKLAWEETPQYAELVKLMDELRVSRKT